MRKTHAQIPASAISVASRHLLLLLHLRHLGRVLLLFELVECEGGAFRALYLRAGFPCARRCRLWSLRCLRTVDAEFRFDVLGLEYGVGLL